jgi:hypothetical protein
MTEAADEIARLRTALRLISAGDTNVSNKTQWMRAIACVALEGK